MTKQKPQAAAKLTRQRVVNSHQLGQTPRAKSWPNSAPDHREQASRSTTFGNRAFRLLLVLGWLLCPTCAFATGLEAQTSSGNSSEVRRWACEPRIGEASNPGPHAYFDNESDDAWSDFEDQPQFEQEYEVDMPPTEHEIKLSTKRGAQPASSIDPPPC